MSIRFAEESPGARRKRRCAGLALMLLPLVAAYAFALASLLTQGWDFEAAAEFPPPLGPSLREAWGSAYVKASLPALFVGLLLAARKVSRFSALLAGLSVVPAGLAVWCGIFEVCQNSRYAPGGLTSNVGIAGYAACLLTAFAFSRLFRRADEAGFPKFYALLPLYILAALPFLAVIGLFLRIAA